MAQGQTAGPPGQTPAKSRGAAGGRGHMHPVAFFTKRGTQLILVYPRLNHGIPGIGVDLDDLVHPFRVQQNTFFRRYAYATGIDAAAHDRDRDLVFVGDLQDRRHIVAFFRQDHIRGFVRAYGADIAGIGNSYQFIIFYLIRTDGLLQLFAD